MLHRDVAPGIHLITRHHVNCYLIEGDDGLTLVDAGLPDFWRPIGSAIRELGRTPEDLRALVLTHAHFDHVGIARRLVDRLGLPVHAHAKEYFLARHPYRYAHEKPIALYPVRHPRALPILAGMLAGGAFAVRGTDPGEPLLPGRSIPVPGDPQVLLTDGHTYGHCALHLPDRDAVVTGDALVTLDPYTGRTGPRIVAGAATADSAQALRSLDAIAATNARHVLPGHGEPWHTGAAVAVGMAREAGSA
jgi:glyoxylase-like metal-dependent hydrolase (beta-lactamase superfamily II)